jgi:hypothetical protein
MSRSKKYISLTPLKNTSNAAIVAKKLSLRNDFPKKNEEVPTKALITTEKMSTILMFNAKALYIKAGRNTSPGGNRSQKSLYGNSPFITLSGLLRYSARSPGATV